MVPGKPVVIFILAVIAFGCVMAFVAAGKLKSIIRNLPAPITSPDGTLTANLTVNEEANAKTYMRLGVEIHDAKTNALIFKRQTVASALRFYELTWTDNNRLHLNSSEIGDLSWTRSPSDWQDDPTNADRVIPAVPTTSPTAGQ
jgi:hypothetical protein